MPRNDAPVTRRAFLRALIGQIGSGFTAIAAEIELLFRWCSFTGGKRLAGAA